MLIGILLFLLLTTLIAWFHFKRMCVVPVRELPIVDKILFGVSLAAEQGKPVIFTTGLTSLGPLMFVCSEILREIAKKCARIGLKLIVPQNDPPSVAFINKILMETYISEGKLSRYDPKSIVFLSEEQFAFAAGYIGIVKRENVGTAFLFGYFAGEALILAESGRIQGAYQIAGSVSPEQLAFFVATCDDVAFGEELYAIGAKMTGNKNILANLRVSDIGKLMLVTVILLGSALASIRHDLWLHFSEYLLTLP
ncbi:MAG: hypothetical protein NZO16_05710 [Deltaproteobacteria bacterium]|nr:hypothetical protein [Deltaproteobacteria bacterium]